MTTTTATMNNIWDTATGSTIIITQEGHAQPETRTVLSRRAEYGTGISLTLDAPLAGKTSTLFTVTPRNLSRIKLVM